MQQKILPIAKNLIAVFVVFVSLIQVYRLPVLANETRDEKVEAISELEAKINYFYLHPNVAIFMNNFYTRESYEYL